MSSTISSRPSRHAGLTLIEVVAAIAILGTVLVGVVVAKARHTRQLARAQRELVAVRAADDLLAQWWTGPRGAVPIGEWGTVDGVDAMTWQTALVDNAPIQRLGARVVRLELRNASTTSTFADAPSDVLVAIDVVVPTTDSASKDGQHE